VPKPKRSFAENVATIAKVCFGEDLRPKEQVPRIASDQPSKPISSNTKTILMACAAFFAVFAIFGPAPQPPQPDRRVLYTGCELRAAIKRCDEFAKAVADGWRASYWIHENMPLSRIIGEPRTEEQIHALAWQDDWFRWKRKEEDTASTLEHNQKIYRQEYERRGVKF
jgi:hypothetical protein